jgi:hypothetical protein
MYLWNFNTVGAEYSQGGIARVGQYPKPVRTTYKF